MAGDDVQHRRRPWTFTTDPVEPDAPRNVEITGFGDGELTVAWDAPLGNGGSTITGYKVQWKEETTPNWDSPSEESDDASPYTIENLTNGTRYDVRVLAVNDVGDGPPSGDVEGTPSTRPKPPTITDITHGHQKLHRYVDRSHRRGYWRIRHHRLHCAVEEGD